VPEGIVAAMPGNANAMNRLASETSPYLLQHAHNPVDWYPWGAEALARAAELDRPIFLSIGYAACHWCHVMERESFEDDVTAGVLNEWFVPIKVDREERPDLDQLYMGAVQAMTGQGGWPMSVFLAPDGRPFFGGTYFPDTPRHGMPSFRQVLQGVHEAWTTQRSEIDDASVRLVEAIAEQQGGVAGGTAMPGPEVLQQAAAMVGAQFDRVNGGWGRAPKFPQPMTIEFLLRRYAAAQDEQALAVATASLDAMAAGGIHDQLGGGFHRYSTDAHWLVPHFEQMLYDNAQLARVYVHAWALTGTIAYRDTAVGVLEYLLRELLTEDGGFAASQDADTEGEEGATFVWSAAEIREVLEAAGLDHALFAAAYGVTEAGNWEGHTILSRVRLDTELGERFGREPEDVAAELSAARGALALRRAQRPQPARDDKVLAAWNGLAIAALADAARALAKRQDGGEPDGDGLGERYRDAADRAARAVLAGLMAPDGRLRRSWKDGRASADGVLEDHANLAEGLLALYEATHDERWYRETVRLADLVLDRFADPAGGFFDTADDGEALVVRPKDVQDNATPSGNAMAATLLLRLAALSGEGRYRSAAERALATVGPLLLRYPTGFAQWLSALEVAHAGITEVALVGAADAPDLAALIERVDRRYRPFIVLAVTEHPEVTGVPLLRDRFALSGRATAFVCRDFACRQPVHEPEALEALLAGP
ncbi:MAG TPA: thioredoxin domain-containing protein, partial [Candidatus Limnocylindrales bacterium]|nr:thioredoxin domain-containing protein [Candidatus Limnocylindrales bacterium]